MRKIIPISYVFSCSREYKKILFESSELSTKTLVIWIIDKHYFQIGPQIVLSVYRDMTLEGYGRAHVPIKPGLHKLDVSLSKPQPSSLLGYIGTFLGYQPELVQPKMLATTEGNSRKFSYYYYHNNILFLTQSFLSVIQMISTGNVMITLNVLTQGFENLGYDVS